jgi:penicillin-binding protein 1C
MTSATADPAARARSFGMDGPFSFPFPVAIKTGTSSDWRDNWAFGYTPEFTVGVWAGNFENQPMKGISGVSGAGPIFHRTMLRLHRDHPPTWFERPPGLVEITLDSRNGKLVPAAPQNPHVRADLAPTIHPGNLPLNEAPNTVVPLQPYVIPVFASAFVPFPSLTTLFDYDDGGRCHR